MDSAPILTVNLPLPPKTLSPNARAHWAAKARDTKKARGWSAVAFTTAMRSSGVDRPLKHVTIQPIFWFRTAHQHDSDNLIASIKAFQDGIADAGLVHNDHDITLLPPKYGKEIGPPEKKDPRLVLEVFAF